MAGGPRPHSCDLGASEAQSSGVHIPLFPQFIIEGREKGGGGGGRSGSLVFPNTDRGVIVKTWLLVDYYWAVDSSQFQRSGLNWDL